MKYASEFRDPKAARALLAAIPEPVPGLDRPAEAIGGEIPSPAAPGMSVAMPSPTARMRASSPRPRRRRARS